MSTRDQLVDRCESKYRDTANVRVTAGEWASYVNDAYMDVLVDGLSWEPPAPFLEARATNDVTTTGEITLPTDCWKITAVYNARDAILLERLSGRSAYRQYYPDPANNLGTPINWRQRANVLELYPRPVTTTSVIIDYIVAPAELGASDEPVFAEAYHRMLVSGALAHAYEDDGEEAFAGIQRSRFELSLQKLKLDSISSGGDSYHVLSDDWGF